MVWRLHIVVGLLVFVLVAPPGAAAGVMAEPYTTGIGTAVVAPNGDITVNAEVLSQGVGGAWFTDPAGFKEAVVVAQDDSYADVPLLVCTGFQASYTAIAVNASVIAGTGCFLSCNALDLTFGATQTEITAFVLLELTDIGGGHSCHSSSGTVVVQTE